MRTFVPPQPNLNAASCANNSPNPSIIPLTNGRSRLMAAPRIRPHNVGGLYNIKGVDELEPGDAERPSPAEYCSLSECIVIPDSAR
jgi:hypothetical protein